MVPKTLHQIWIGPSRIPAELLEWARTWAEHHPEWDRVLWTDKPAFHGLEGGPWNVVQELPPIINAWAYENVVRYVGARAQWAARSDIVRMEIIARYGGVYADLDVEIFRPTDELFEGVKLAIASQFGHGVGNYLFASEPNHPALWTAVRQLERTFPDLDAPTPTPAPLTRWQRLRGRKPTPARQLPNILELTGPSYLFPRLASHADCVVFPWQIFNPAIPQSRTQAIKQWPASAYGNHNFVGTWYDRANTEPHPVFTGGTIPEPVASPYA